MIDLLQTIWPFMIWITILVFIHELGHFLAAKWSGMRADVFAIGMGPRVFGWNKHTGFTFGKLPENLDLGDDTDFRVAAFPIGGYVKIAGMVDESMDIDFTQHQPKPWEFRSKSTLAKMFVISAGVIMNFLLAIVIFSALNMLDGYKVRDTTIAGPVPEKSPAYAAGIREGDVIKSVNGMPVQYFEQIDSAMFESNTAADATVEFEQQGTLKKVVIPRAQIETYVADNYPSILPYSKGMVVLVNGVLKDSAAFKAGLKPEDRVLAINGRTVATIDQMKEILTEYKNTPIPITIERNGQRSDLTMKPNADGQIGVGIEPDYTGPKRQLSYGFFGSVSSGTGQVFTTIKLIVNAVSGVFLGKTKVKDAVGGPVMIAKMAKRLVNEGLSSFIRGLALLSVMLGFMNILPIPALDGGHLVFIIVEAVIRREVPVKIRMAVQQVGVVMLLLFMGFVLYNDFTR